MTNTNIKAAQPDHPIHPALAARFSPYIFDPKPIEDAKLQSCFEAARWAASSFNEQPWVFILAKREDQTAFENALDCLLEANQAWAKDAGAIILTSYATSFTRNNNPNRVAAHDLGLATGNFSFQASQLGLQIHEMGGVNLAKMRQNYSIPDTHEPCTAIAIGYAGDPTQLDSDIAARDKAPRQRKPLNEWVFGETWGQPASAVE
jgi:nitroreductase